MKTLSSTIILLIFGSFLLTPVWANPILITWTDDTDRIEFDGKWTHKNEWKKTSLNTYSYGEDEEFNQFVLRSAHQDNFIYFLIDFVTDTHLEPGMDKAMICLNNLENSKNEQFCFISILESDSIIKKSENSQIFKEIEQPENFINNSTKSDENDRYSKTPHSTYEFKIPTDLVGRSSEYGIFLAVFEANENKIYTMPSGFELITFDDMPHTTKWGTMISPDKSLPEFHWILVVTIPSFLLVIFLSKSKMMNNFRI